MGFARAMTVALHDELGGRTVVDGHGGRRHRLAPVPLEPSWLPPGWRLLLELGQTGAGGPVWERTYGPGPDAGGAAAGVGEVTVAAGPAVVARPAVRGRRAVVELSEADQLLVVRWREGGRGLAVRAAFPASPSDRTVAAVRDLLVRIAQGLG
jgi:hypothetical protein